MADYLRASVTDLLGCYDVREVVTDLLSTTVSRPVRPSDSLAPPFFSEPHVSCPTPRPPSGSDNSTTSFVNHPLRTETMTTKN